jgi:hypothetical protein
VVAADGIIIAGQVTSLAPPYNHHTTSIPSTKDVNNLSTKDVITIAGQLMSIAKLQAGHGPTLPFHAVVGCHSFGIHAVILLPLLSTHRGGAQEGGFHRPRRPQEAGFNNGCDTEASVVHWLRQMQASPVDLNVILTPPCVFH